MHRRADPIWRRGRAAHRPGNAVPYGELSNLRNYLASAGGRLYVGAVSGGVALADPQHAVLVLGPPRAGKTTALAVPNVLAAPGPVIATSTKPDVLVPTLGIRSGLGRCWVLDPTGTVSVPPGVERIRWSPVSAAATWDESLVVARGMVGVARPAGRRGESAHWTERAEALMAPLLHAAHLSGAGMESVLKWVLRQDLDRPAAVLAIHGVETASDVVAGIAATDQRELSGIFSSTAGVLAAYRSDAVLDGASAVNFDPRSLTRSGDTVYVCAPARHQDLVAPIVVAFLEQARAGCFSARARGEPGLAVDPGARRGGQHRPAARSSGAGQRGRRSGSSHPGVPSGPVSGKAAVGSGGRRVPVVVRHQSGSARDRRPGHSGAGVQAGRRG